jgi:ubiquinone/menaquinone biosynthesis C-methylase UbiE
MRILTEVNRQSENFLVSSYLGRHAELYDTFYAEKPYAAEAEFVHSCIDRYRDGESIRMLELACGTGNHALEFEQRGYKVTATDYSSDMLSQAQEKAERVGSRVVFLQQDMRSLTLPANAFDVAVCLFDSIGYVATNESLSNVLMGVHRCLRPGGLFVFEFWHAALIKKYDPLRVRKWQLPNSEILRISETVLMPEQQLASVTYSIYELKSDGTYSHLREVQTNRYFLVQEMSHWLTMSGFSPVEWFSGFSRETAITEDSWHIVVIAKTEQLQNHATAFGPTVKM